MASPPTPDSDHTIRPSENLLRPLRQTRLYELSDPFISDSEKCELPSTAGMLIPTHPNPMSSSTKDQAPDHGARQHQRQASEFPVPRSTFIPPESPKDLSATKHFKSLGANLDELKPTEPVDNYKGVKSGSRYLRGPELASSFRRQALPPDSYDGHNDSPESKSTFTGPSVNTSMNSTPSKLRYNPSDTTSLISDWGHTYESPGNTHRYHVPHQTKTFEQLASDQGVRQWDSKKLDDRWTLGSSERSFNNTYEPLGNQWSTPSPWNDDRTSDHHSSPTKSEKRRDTRHTEQPLTTSIVQQASSLVPNPPELARLAALVSDMVNYPSALGPGYSPKVVQSYFHDRVFGSRDGPEPLRQEEAAKFTMHNGKVKTLADVRSYVHGVIEELGNMCLEHDKQIDNETNEIPQSAFSYAHHNPSIYHDYRTEATGSQIHQGSPKTQDGHATASYGQENSQVSQNTSRPSLGRLQTNLPPPTDRMQQQQQTSSAESTETMGSMTAHLGSMNLSSQGSANTPWAPSSTRQTAASTYFGGAYPDLLSAQQANARKGTSALNAQDLGYLQLQSQASWNQSPYQHLGSIQGQTYQTAAGIHGPNGIFIPHDRHVRPPASNRMAPLFAHSGAWQANRGLGTQVSSTGRSTPTLTAPNSGRQTRQPTPVQHDNRRLAYLEGSDEMYPQPVHGGGASIRLQNLVRNPIPDYNVITHDSNIPFVETARASKPAEWGVLKLGNIPYDLSKSQVTTFLGNHAKLITPDIGPAIHIVMDRSTGKTLDCFVEFFSQEDARVWEKNIQGRSNQHNRIGDRLITVELSSQGALLKELFPRAKNVCWKTGHPVIQEPEEPYNSGFKAFISPEELGIHLRHAEQPTRSNYTMRCQNRPYEAMISLLAKFPWQDTEHYTMSIRNKIFEAVQKMLGILCREIRRNNSADRGTPQSAPQPYPSGMIGTGLPYPPATIASNGYNNGISTTTYTVSLPRQPLPPTTSSYGRNLHLTKSLTPALLNELLRTALNTPGFSELQRWEIYHCVGADLNVRQNYTISPLGQHWPFEALGRKRNMEEDVVMWYARVMGQECDALEGMGPGMGESTAQNPFGGMRKLFFGIAEEATMDQAGMVEWEVMGKLVTGFVRRAYEFATRDMEEDDDGEGEQLALQ